MVVMKGPVAAPISDIAIAAASLACNWTSAAQLVGQIQADKLIVPDVVAQCPNVCQVAFTSTTAPGALAGDGISFSYHVQVTLVCLFGALLPIIIWLSNVFSWKNVIEATPLYHKLQKSVYNTTAFFSISLLVASIFRWGQAPPILETVFISYVVWTQLPILITMLFGQMCSHVLNKANLPWYYQVYYAAIAIAQLATSCVVEVPHPKIYQELAVQCHMQHQFINISPHLPASEKGTTMLKAYVIGVSVCLVVAILAAVYRKVLLRLCPMWLKTYGHVTFLITMLLLLPVSNIIIAFITDDVRGILNKLSANTLPESSWDYAQTTAVLLWIPFFCAGIKEHLQYDLAAGATEQIDTEKQGSGRRNETTLSVQFEGPPAYTTEKYQQKSDATLPV